MDAKTRLLYWLFDASRGGPTRLRLLKVLNKKPMNKRQLSLNLNLDYKTIQGHINILLENGIIFTPKKSYGSIFFISPEWENKEYLKYILKGDKYEKEKNK